MVVENSNLDSKEKVDLKEEQEKNLEKLKKEFEEYKSKLSDIKEHEHNINYFINIKKKINSIIDFWSKINDKQKDELEEFYSNLKKKFLKKYNLGELTKENIFKELDKKLKEGLDFYDNNYIQFFKEIFYEDINSKYSRKIGDFIYKGLLTKDISDYFNFFKEIKEKKRTDIYLPGIGKSKKNEVIALYFFGVEERGLGNSQYGKGINYDFIKNRFKNEIKDISKNLIFDNEYIETFKKLEPDFNEDIFKQNLIIDRIIFFHNNKKKEKKKKNKTQNKEQSKNENKIDEKMEDIIYLLKNKGQIILYGPPGTGKTYMTKEIIKEFIKSENNVEKDFSELKKENRVEFITFHPSYSYEEFIEGITFDVNNENSEEKYILKDGVFKEFCKLAEKNYRKSKEGDKEIDFEKLIEYSFNDLKEEEKIKIKTKKSEFYIYDYNDRTIYFEKKNKDRSHSLCIKTLKKIFEDKDENVSKYIKGGLEPYYKALINFLNEKLQKIERNSFVYDKEELKPYFLIIDEINRGDISKIFGELITLLEKDKRLGEENEIISKLPYSNEDFGVPPNLYVIGTMNTADKSIANLDVALRRRFGFVEIAPDFEDNSNLIEYLKEKNLYDNPLLKSSIEKIKEINNKIKEEPTLGKDKMIGHSFFFKLENIDNLEKDLRLIWNNEIIPLIEEYTYGNEEEMNKILGLNNEENIKKFFDEKVKENSKNPENESN